MNKFYDITPDNNSLGHWVCQNGIRIARFDDLSKAEELRAYLVGRQIEAASRL